jgi:hypothetical protein
MGVAAHGGAIVVAVATIVLVVTIATAIVVAIVAVVAIAVVVIAIAIVAIAVVAVVAIAVVAIAVVAIAVAITITIVVVVVVVVPHHGGHHILHLGPHGGLSGLEVRFSTLETVGDFSVIVNWRWLDTWSLFDRWRRTLFFENAPQH